MIDLARLRELCGKATPLYKQPCSPFRPKPRDLPRARVFHADNPGVVVAEFFYAPRHDSEFYCAASPAVVLALLDRIEEAERVLRDVAESYVDHELQRGGSISEDAINAVRAALKAKSGGETMREDG